MTSTSAPPPAPRPRGAMDQPMTRRSCLLGALLWLVVMLLPACALFLAVRGEIAWQRGDFVEDRVWLVQQEGRGGQDSLGGLAYSATRIASDERADNGDICVRTRVYIWLWQGESETVTYCECYTPRPGDQPGYVLQGECS